MNYKKERKKKRLTQSQVAIASGISLMSYQLIERGVTKNPHPDNLKAIKAVLRKTV